MLLVDDHADTLDVLGQVLRNQGAAVVTAAAARPALDLLESVNVIVADYKLPVEDGVWLLQQVRARGYSMPVIAFTGFVSSHVPSLASADFARVLLKPLDPWQLADEILAVMSGCSTASRKQPRARKPEKERT